MNDGRSRVLAWHQQFAPGLTPQPIPERAMVRPPLEPLIPYGLQYQLVLPDGSVFPRHQSGPGATVIVTDGQRVALSRDIRKESGEILMKACGGFAGYNRDAATDIVSIFQRLEIPGSVTVRDKDYPHLEAFLRILLAREYGGFLLEHDIEFLDRQIGYPNIRICSIVGRIVLEPVAFDATSFPVVLSRNEALRAWRERKFGDEITDRLICKLLA